MPEIPAEAVQAAVRAMVTIYAGYESDSWTATDEEAGRAAVEAAAPFLAGAGSPTTCPSVASDSTESAQTAPAAPVYRPGVEKPSESLTALHALARVRALHNPVEYGGMTICAACSPFHQGGIRRYVLTPYPCSTVLVLDGAGAVPGEHTAAHSCGNCEGIDPASCINAPRPPASTTEETNR